MVRRYVGRIGWGIFRGFIAGLVFLAAIILTQDVQIFPGMYMGGGTPEQVPAGVESHLLTTIDGETIEAWYLPAERSDRRIVALYFHGNGGTLHGFFPFQKWLESLGISSWSIDYRGFGRSTGWPSEEGIYRDADALAAAALARRAPEEKVVIIGSSIGTGPATYLAKTIGADAAVLFSPFKNFVDLVREIPLVGLATPFLRYQFPNDRYLSEARLGCVLLVHGGKDTTISASHSVALVQSMSQNTRVHLILEAEAGHNDILHHSKREVGIRLLECLSVPSTAPDQR